MQLRDFLDIPYVNKGRNLLGCDCYGLVSVYYKKMLGINIKRFDDCYEDANNNIEIDNVIKSNKYMEWLKVEELKPNDLIIFRVNRYPMHIGIYVGDNKFLHTLKSLKTSCIEKLNSPIWDKRIVEYVRHCNFK